MSSLHDRLSRRECYLNGRFRYDPDLVRPRHVASKINDKKKTIV